MNYEDERLERGSTDQHQGGEYGDSGEYTNPVVTLEPEDIQYPQRLRDWPGRRMPTKLTCIGNTELMERRPLVMICGARNASLRALELAGTCASRCGSEGIVIVSGYARGVDIIAHREVLLAGGSTIAVLPYGMNRFRYDASLGEYIDEQRFLGASELFPASHFTVKHALRRNRIMVALSDVVIVVEPGDTGGTWSSASAAVEFGRPLFFIEGDRPECVPKLTKMGGNPVPAGTDGIPDMTTVLGYVNG